MDITLFLLLIGLWLYFAKDGLIEFFMDFIEPKEGEQQYRDFLKIGNYIRHSNTPESLSKARNLVNQFEKFNRDEVGRLYASQLQDMLQRRRNQITVLYN